MHHAFLGTLTGGFASSFFFLLAWCVQDLERKEAPKTGYEISERAGTSRRMQFAKAIAFVAIIVGMALVAKRRGRNIIGSLRARMREQLGR